jgi:hypothetical protein
MDEKERSWEGRLEKYFPTAGGFLKPTSKFSESPHGSHLGLIDLSSTLAEHASRFPTTMLPECSSDAPVQQGREKF